MTGHGVVAVFAGALDGIDAAVAAQRPRAAGASLGTFMRIDFLGTDSLAAFNEFSSTPTVNRPEFTPYCNELFGRLWHDTFPDAI